MKYVVTVEGAFETELEVDAESCNKAKILAAERYLSDFPAPSSFRIEMVSVPTEKKEKC